MGSAVEISEIIRNYGIVVGGFAGISIAGWRALAAARQAKSSEREAHLSDYDHIVALYRAAVQDLSSTDELKRTGALHVLSYLYWRDDAFDDAIWDIVQAFLQKAGTESDPEAEAPDVKVAKIFVGEVLDVKY